MRVFAYCAQPYAEPTRRAAGVNPMTCPPVSADTFIPEWLNGHDFLYFDLHGLPNAGYWYDEQPGPVGMAERTVALWDWQIKAADLSGAVVFAANCYLTDGPMLPALFGAGAAYVVGGAGKNYSGKSRVAGASQLGELFRHALEAGLPPEKAFSKAKKLFRVKSIRDMFLGQIKPAERQDTLEFQIFGRDD